MNELFTTLLRDAIGYDPLSKFGTVNAIKYPPHNILKNGDKYTIKLAVAGFGKEDLDVVVDNGILKVSGHKQQLDESTDTEVLYHGIAFRDFDRQWQLGEYVEVTGVSLENGLLIISLERQLPESKKAKSFDIK